MIITKLQGGLGNQLFQWAFGKALSFSLNDDEYLDDSFYADQRGVTKRSFELNKFSNAKCAFLYYDILKSIVRIDEINDIFCADKTLQLLEWKKYSQTCNYHLNGYWQSEKYFKKHEDVIRQQLSMTENEKLSFQNIIDENSISLHLRRTDYLTSNGYHPVQDISYFSNGIDIIGDYNKIYVFSDEIEWCKTNLNFPRMVFMEGYSNIEDLRLMSLCKHNIIANSSFSWWAAWLNENKDKKVIAPKQWFGPQANLNEQDIVPETWIKI